MASQVAGQRYDLVIFGATGYTGQYVVDEMARVVRAEEKKGHDPPSWAVAGRSKDKLLKALAAAEKETGVKCEDAGVILADVADQASIDKMAAQANVLINCVGPYYLYGESVVKACIEHGASHVDISGEPQFMEKMQLKYNKAAEEAGVHIVGACGWDSVPAEMGLVHMIKNFKGELNSVQMYATVKSRRAKVNIHTGTMESAALFIANSGEIQSIRRELYPTRLPKPSHKVVKKSLHKNDKLGMWAIPFMSDEPQVYRTQRYRHDVLGKRPIQFHQFMGMPSLFQAIATIIGMAYFGLISYFSLTRKLLFKYPEVMTAGVFTRAGADREELKRVTFTSILLGSGWSEALTEASDQHTKPPDASITVKVSGPDPGYAATSTFMVATAMTILQEKSACSGRGGVMTPGMAFPDTKLIERLQDYGITFVVEDQ